MTGKLKIFNAQIAQALVSKDFDSLFSLFSSNSFSFLDLLVFYKRNDKIFKDQAFWLSRMPHFHLESALNSSIKVEFLQSYLSKNEFCSPELDGHLLAIAKGDYIRHFKLWKAFNHSNFIASIKELGASDPELGKVVKELEVIIKAQEKIKDEEVEDDNAFLTFNLGEVIFAFVLYFHEFKQSVQVAGNNSLLTKVEMALVDGLNHIFSIFRGKPNMTVGFSSNETLQDQFHRNEVSHHLFGKEGLDIPNEPKFQRLSQLINRLIDRKGRKGQLELYLCEYSDFKSNILNPAPLKTNRSYQVFKINNAKSIPEELYFYHQTNFSRTDITASVEILKFYGIPDQVASNSNMIEVKKALQLLKYFSVFKGPIERGIFPDRTFIVLNQADNQFIEILGPNESITLFEYDKLTEGITKYFNWTPKEVKLILAFLTFEFAETDFPSSWLYRPFLKFNNQILWLGSFLKNRRWDIILLNKLKKEPVHASIISRNFELKVEAIFRNNLFKTVSGLRFSSSNGQSGDFDILAFKDNYLFVCEAKTGVRSDEFRHATQSEIVRLEGLAAEQLEKEVFNIKEDWANIKAKFGIDRAVSLDSINIVPLIITDFFEGDLHLYKNTIRKISLLELDVILKNKKKELLQFYEERYSQLADSENPDINMNRSVISNWDLWEGKSNLEVETLLLNIDQNTIWKELETIWKFEDEGYWIEY